MNRPAGFAFGLNRPASVLAAQYFLYFGVLGVFLPYFNLYLHRIGFSGLQIGTLSALRSLCLMLFPVFWSALADRFEIRRPLFIACSTISATIWGFYLLTTDFWPMVAITLAYGIFFSPLISFMEAFTMDVLGGEKRRYGQVRVWGTGAFIAVVLIMGRVIDRYPIDIVVVLIFFGALMSAAVALKVPRPSRPGRTGLAGGVRGLLSVRLAVFLACGVLMLMSHGTYYGFFSIHLADLGYSSTFIGIAWALAPAAEVIVMLGSSRIFGRFAVERVLVFSFGAAALRWLILALTAHPAIILVSQLAHAFTYGAFHVASILYIDRLAPAAAKTVGQAVNNAVTYGLGMMLGFYLNGWLYERVGGFALFAGSGAAALVGGVLLGAFFRRDQVA
jgi:MFS transporter, PPP family, 3-phenylpropionic acid transporter